MNPEQTFETFSVGPNNNFARDAAWAVAQAPGKLYNPLFISGRAGVGKTHLLHAIGQEISGRQPNAKVIYNSAEGFLNEFIEAIVESNLAKFRLRYRGADVLLMDDVHCLANMGRTQEEFLKTFEARFIWNKQIVLSGNRVPSEIANLHASLASRFEWGLTAEIYPAKGEVHPGKRRRRLS
jgi:chromosomal replication initiator protein